MRCRRSARWLLENPDDEVLLFRFCHAAGPLKGQAYWATPGGELEPGETFEQAAVRELREETGLVIDVTGPQIARREFLLQLPDGERVLADERFFRLDTDHFEPSKRGWSAQEQLVMVDYRWWPKKRILETTETIWPENLIAILDGQEETLR